MKNESGKTVLPFDVGRKVDVLKERVAAADPEEQVSILSEINHILEGRDVDLLLSIAIRNFHLGNDGAAIYYLSLAREVAPYQHSTLRVWLFLSLALKMEDGDEACRQLLAFFPTDEWALAMKERMRSGNLSSISLPNVFGQWSLE